MSDYVLNPNLTRLAPNTAKVYLILLALQDPESEIPLLRLPMPHLARKVSQP